MRMQKVAHRICLEFQELISVPDQPNRRQRRSCGRVGRSFGSIASTNLAAGLVVLEVFLLLYWESAENLSCLKGEIR